MPAPGTNTASIPPAAAEDSVEGGVSVDDALADHPAQVP